MSKVEYTAAEVQQITGVTAAGLEHLVRSQTVIPAEEAPRRGMSRLYSFANIVEVAIAIRLVAMGVNVRIVREAIALVRRNWDWQLKPMPTAPRKVDVLWIGFVSDTLDDRQSELDAGPVLLQSEYLALRIKANGAFGVAVGLNEIFAAIEHITSQLPSESTAEAKETKA